MGTLHALPLPPGGDMFEPHVAVDPADPRRVAVSASMLNSGEEEIRRQMWCWRTEDGGATWTDGVVRHALWGNGGSTSDAQLAYGAEGELIASFLALDPVFSLPDESRELIESGDRASYSLEELDKMVADHARGKEFTDHLAVTPLDSSGSWGPGIIIPDTAGADRESFAVDNRVGSPYLGRMYIAWVDADLGRGIEEGLLFARSVDGGKSFEKRQRLGEPAKSSVVVAPDGTVHVLWTIIGRDDMGTPEGRRGIFHAVSTDGGETFDEPGLAVLHGGGGRVSTLEVAAAPHGGLLAVWAEADQAVRERGVQRRQTIRFAHSRDGRRWSEASTLLEPPADTSQALPAVAATDDGWHVLFYEADSRKTTVRIASASFEELDFQTTHELASRGFDNQDFNLLGNWEMSAAPDMVKIGDYIGLAGAGSTLAAAIVLPEGDEWPSPRHAYAWIADSRKRGDE